MRVGAKTRTRMKLSDVVLSCCSAPSCIIASGSKRWEANMPCTIADYHHAHRDEDNFDNDDDDADNGFN